jgi:hypothetical protein
MCNSDKRTKISGLHLHECIIQACASINDHVLQAFLENMHITPRHVLKMTAHLADLIVSYV